MTTLGIQFRYAVLAITDLIVSTRSTAMRRALRKQHADIAAQLLVLIDANVDAALPEYRAATEALIAATKAARNARDDFNRTSESIDKISTAIEKLAALTSMSEPPAHHGLNVQSCL